MTEADAYWLGRWDDCESMGWQYAITKVRPLALEPSKPRAFRDWLIMLERIEDGDTRSRHSARASAAQVREALKRGMTAREFLLSLAARGILYEPE